jgi:hypothetical protein
VSLSVALLSARMLKQRLRGQLGGDFLFCRDQLDGNVRRAGVVGENPSGSGGQALAIFDADADFGGDEFSAGRSGYLPSTFTVVAGSLTIEQHVEW